MEKKLEEKFKDHALQDNSSFKNCRECHIEPDWLLVYVTFDDMMILQLIGTGTHSDIF